MGSVIGRMPGVRFNCGGVRGMIDFELQWTRVEFQWFDVQSTLFIRYILLVVPPMMQI